MATVHSTDDVTSFFTSSQHFSVRMILTITEEGTAQIHFCMVEQTVMFIVYVMRVFASMDPMLTVLFIIIL